MMNQTENMIQAAFSQRINQVPRSFIRDILSVTNKPEIISFAGGLPNKDFFPIEEIKACTQKVLEQEGHQALQYSTTEGLPALREQICANYKKQGLKVSPNQVLITTGSQQALDLIGKVFIDKGDRVLIEEPAYLGAIQAMSMYEPEFYPVPLTNQGLNPFLLEETLIQKNIKLAYLVPNFQNPSGISYTEQRRAEVAELITKHNVLIIEDDPYGSIRFGEKAHHSLYYYAPEHTFMLGTFSKTVAPGFRIGWIVAPNQHYYEKLVTAKQAADLHSDIFSQRIISSFLSEYELENHIKKIIKAYKSQSEVMIQAMEEHFPSEASFTKPQGGMFCWVNMPSHFSAMKLFHEAIKQNVAFVPGVPFYIGKQDSNTFRLNFSCSTPEEIQEGIRRLSEAIKNNFT
ncbi:aminotransferase-like domain-containing protein [Labilibacter marinus]|uniref:aminotransferase-like domain-containing protein n=1 Tax=Labilibacter marinus TaxID=1477105 RepID=UPI0018E91104|nr:PLP-dependent aminotransferase family protein [Labilibacter marinus]